MGSFGRGFAEEVAASVVKVNVMQTGEAKVLPRREVVAAPTA